MIVRNEKLDYTAYPYPGNMLYLFTGNSFITKEGKLVMGAGAAKEIRDYFLMGVDEMFGRLISPALHLDNYYIQISATCNLGVFQVKRHFKDPADLDLIAQSAYILSYMLRHIHYDEVRMNFPGIGYGGLTYEEVLPKLECLPDNVVLYKV